MSGEKKAEVRKTRPDGREPFRVFIYCTKGEELWGDGSGETWKGIAEDEDLQLVFELNPTLTLYNGKVIGEFICDYIDEIIPDFQFGYLNYLDLDSTCLTIEEINKYGNGKPLHGWHISNFKLYDKPKELSDFIKKCPNNKLKDCVFCYYYDFNTNRCSNRISRPPQSWQYILDK